MGYRQLVSKNLRHSPKKFMPFFLSCYLAVVIFVVYMTLLFNPSIDVTGFSAVKFVIAICNIIIVIFSLIYVTYAMQASLGLRKYEFGIMYLMGVSDRKIRQSIRYEIIYIGSSAIILGTISGVILSKVLFKALASALCISGAAFMIDPKGILLSVALFMIMFLIIAMSNARKITRTKPLDLINAQRTPEKALHNPTLGFMANLISRKWVGLNYRFLYVFSRLKFNIATNWKLMFVSSILQTCILVFVGFTFSGFVQDSTIADNRYAADLCILVSTDPAMYLEKETLDQIDLLSQSQVKSRGALPMIFAVDAMNNSVIGIISSTSYGTIAKTPIVDGDADSMLVMPVNQAGPQSSGSRAIEFLVGGSQRLLNVDTIYDLSFALSDTVRRYLVISDDEYRKCELLYSEHQGRILTYSFDDWHASTVLTEQIISLINKSNPHYNTNNVVSKWTWYQSFHQFSAQLSFLAIFIGALFYLAVGSIFLFRQLNEMDKMKQIYKSLFRLGIPETTIKQLFGIELSIVHMLPLLIAVLLSYGLIIVSIIRTAATADVVFNVIKNSLIVIAFYSMIQLGYYYITKNMIVNRLQKKDAGTVHASWLMAKKEDA